MKNGESKGKISSFVRKIIIGWKIGAFFGDWLLRAAGAKTGIYGNDAVKATYPMTKTLANGKALVGGKSPMNRYLINSPMLAE